MKGKSQEEKKKRFLLYLTNPKELKKKTKDVLLTPKMQGQADPRGSLASQCHSPGPLCFHLRMIQIPLALRANQISTMSSSRLYRQRSEDIVDSQDLGAQLPLFKA